MKKLLSFLAGDILDENIGLLLLRVVSGGAMMTHGFPKILAGPGWWGKTGGIMASIGVPGPAVLWGFMAALAESAGALGLALGFLTRLSASSITIAMSVAAFVYHAGDSFEVREKALLYLFISLFYAIKGPGRVSVDRWIKGA